MKDQAVPITAGGSGYCLGMMQHEADATTNNLVLSTELGC